MNIKEENKHIYQAAKKARHALEAISIKDVISSKKRRTFHPLLALEETISIGDFLKQLKEHNFLSAPVYRTLPDKSRVYTGIVSVSDVVAASVFEQIFDSTEEFDEANFFDFIDRLEPETFFKSPVKSLIAASKESANPWILYSGEPITALIDLFTKQKQHRCLVIDEEVLRSSLITPIPASASLCLLSQTDVLRYLHTSKQVGGTKLSHAIVEPILDVPISSLPSLGGPKAIMAVLDTHSALHGFRTMFIDQLQGLPIVSHNGEVVGNLSASDMRGVTVDNLKSISLPVYEFLEKMGRSPDDTIKVDQVRTLSLEESLESAMEKLLKLKIHRLWVSPFL